MQSSSSFKQQDRCRRQVKPATVNISFRHWQLAKTAFDTSMSEEESCEQNFRIPFESFRSQWENEIGGICHTMNVLDMNHVKNKINSEQADHCNVFSLLSLINWPIFTKLGIYVITK
jgi:hypothetical protein